MTTGPGGEEVLLGAPAAHGPGQPIVVEIDQFYDEEEGVPDVVHALPNASAPVVSNDGSGGQGSAVQRTLQRAGQLIGAAAGTGVSAFTGVGPVGTIVGDAIGKCDWRDSWGGFWGFSLA